MIEKTITNGQTFQWFKVDNYYLTTINNTGVKVVPNENNFKVEPKHMRSEVENSLGLKKDFEEVYNNIVVDNFMQKCVNEYRGLSLVNDSFFPCLISYITSSQNNVKRIRNLMWELRDSLGEETQFDINTFPDREKILREQELEDLGFGYRSDYIYRTCDILEDFKSEDEIEKMSLDEARKELKNLIGVGDKVADCVLLYSLDFTQVFPVDVWTRRAVKKYYTESYSEDDSELKENMVDIFSDYAGYAQVYIYTYIRENYEKS